MRAVELIRNQLVVNLLSEWFETQEQFDLFNKNMGFEGCRLFERNLNMLAGLLEHCESLDTTKLSAKFVYVDKQ